MNDELKAIAATAKRICQDWTRTTAAERGGWAEDVWKSLSEADFTLLPVPEAVGGLGAGLSEAAAVIREVARFAVPIPLVETGLLAGWLLAEADKPVPPGPLTAAVSDELVISRCRGGYRLTGTIPRVPYGRIAEQVVVLRAGPQPRVVTVPQIGAVWERGHNLAGEPRDTLTLRDTVVAPVNVTAVDASALAEQFQLRGALGRALMLSGAMDAAVDSATRHAGQRTQFGRPIGRFQAVQHHLAAMAGEAAVGAVAALSAVADGEPDWLLVAAAKAQTSRAAGVVARLAHQVHGAVGFTEEHSLRLYTTRLWSWRDEFGSERFWERLLGEAACRAPSLWALVTRSGKQDQHTMPSADSATWSEVQT